MATARHAAQDAAGPSQLSDRTEDAKITSPRRPKVNLAADAS